MGKEDHGFKRISRISRILICVNLLNSLKSVFIYEEDKMSSRAGLTVGY